nr:HAMP domain-containing sensor histidine kinase [Microbispora sp. H10830]
MCHSGPASAGDPSARVPAPIGEDGAAVPPHAERMPERLADNGGRLDRKAERRRRFLSGASHELLTPLAGLRAQLEEARLHPAETDLTELVDRSLKDVDRLQAVVSGLLLLLKAETKPPPGRRAADLAELVRTEVSSRAHRSPVLLRLIDGVAVHAVEHEMHHLLGNLLDNAQRHARSRVLVEVRQEGAHAELAVSDDGGGIAEADRERVFEPFTRLEEPRSAGGGGSGLGLAIAREIVRAHGGTIGVEDGAEGGARFVVRLPLADPAPGRGA